MDYRISVKKAERGTSEATYLSRLPVEEKGKGNLCQSNMAAMPLVPIPKPKGQV